MRFTKRQYETAIQDLKLAATQLEPDGHCCAVCGDSGHQAFECGFNPLVAMRLCRTIQKQSHALHETLHYLAAGVLLGLADEQESQEDATCPT